MKHLHEYYVEGKLESFNKRTWEMKALNIFAWFAGFAFLSAVLLSIVFCWTNVHKVTGGKA